MEQAAVENTLAPPGCNLVVRAGSADGMLRTLLLHCWDSGSGEAQNFLQLLQFFSALVKASGYFSDSSLSLHFLLILPLPQDLSYQRKSSDV